MKAMIFAAGLGTRLKPITDTLPKALVPVCGKPLLAHVVGMLKDAGFSEIVINVHHFADKIKAYVKEQDNFGIDIRISEEVKGPLETGGGIKFAKDLILPTDRFFIHNVDIIDNLDIKDFISRARPDSLSTILVSERETKRYFLFDDDMKLAGWTNIATGEVKSPYGDINPDNYRKLAFAGIHNMSSGIFDAFDDLGFSGKFGITDFYIAACKKYPIYGIVPENLKMVDVGKIESLSEAERIIQELI